MNRYVAKNKIIGSEDLINSMLGGSVSVSKGGSVFVSAKACDTLGRATHIHKFF